MIQALLGLASLLAWQASTPRLANLGEFELRLLAEEAEWRNQDRQCAELYRLASERDPVRAGINSYQRARCLARAADLPAALAALQMAVARGYRETRHLPGDPLFSGLHRSPVWQEILARAQANAAAYRQTVNAHLWRHYEEDQADRRPLPSVWTADARRRDLVTRILAQGGAKVSDDYFHAAMVFQHGDRRAHIQLAQELALKAVELDPHNGQARWLYAAATDRRLLAEGKLQRYGTQFTSGPDGRMVLSPVEPGVPDAERRKWNVMPLARMQLIVARTNRLRRPAPAAPQRRD
jgi:hypothetical protein